MVWFFRFLRCREDQRRWKSEFNPRYAGRSSKPYNVHGGVVSGRAGVTPAFQIRHHCRFWRGSKFKTGACHRFGGGRKSPGISILRVDDHPGGVEVASKRMSPRGDIACSWRTDFFREKQKALQPWQPGLFDALAES
jgi:hypothetical protein